MSRVNYSSAAVAGIHGIGDYTAKTWSMDQADRYIDVIREELAAGKNGRTVDVRDTYLKYAVGKHIFFRAGDGIAVIRVLHQKMDTERRG